MKTANFAPLSYFSKFPISTLHYAKLTRTSLRLPQNKASYINLTLCNRLFNCQIFSLFLETITEISRIVARKKLYAIFFHCTCNNSGFLPFSLFLNYFIWKAEKVKTERKWRGEIVRVLETERSPIYCDSISRKPAYGTKFGLKPLQQGIHALTIRPNVCFLVSLLSRQIRITFKDSSWFYKIYVAIPNHINPQENRSPVPLVNSQHYPTLSIKLNVSHRQGT